MTLLERARELKPELVAIRRDLHRHPELSFQEVRTGDRATEVLERLGLPVRRGVGRTGLVAEVENGSGPTVALRADMDALPIQEDSEAPYASTVPGVMHACGHDAHVAGLLGAARLLVEQREAGRLPPGRVRLLFQPSEEGMDLEGKSGAMRMVEEGAMEGVEAVVGLHVGGHLPAGTLHFREGPFMAGSDELLVDVLGRSSHGARPQDGVDAILLASAGVMAAHTVVSRQLSPLDQGVLSLGRIQGGVAANVLADRVHLHGTLRYFRDPIQKILHHKIRGAFQGVRAMGGEVEVTIRPGYPPVVNDPGVTGLVREVAEGIAGGRSLREGGLMMEAEDFAFLARVAPGTFFWLGAAPAEPRNHHHPRFDIDESVLPLGSAVLAGAAMRLLERHR